MARFVLKGVARQAGNEVATHPSMTESLVVMTADSTGGDEQLVTPAVTVVASVLATTV